MTATIHQMPTCRFDRQFILTGQNALTRAFDEAGALLTAAFIGGQRGAGINGRITALAAMVAALGATRPDAVDDGVCFTSASGNVMAVSLRAVPAFLRTIVQ